MHQHDGAHSPGRMESYHLVLLLSFVDEWVGWICCVESGLPDLVSGAWHLFGEVCLGLLLLLPVHSAELGQRMAAVFSCLATVFLLLALTGVCSYLVDDGFVHVVVVLYGAARASPRTRRRRQGSLSQGGWLHQH